MLAAVPAGFTESVVASSLTSPITMAMEPSGHRLWVAFQDGRLGVVEHDVMLPQIAYTLPCDGSGERGFQGIVLDPAFDANGYIYVYYTAATPESHNRLSRLTVDPTTENTILPGSEVVLLDLPLFSQLPTNQSPIWHMGGAIHFLQDDTIAIQVGDHLNNSIVQNNNSPLGKILRVNADGAPATNNPFYSPADSNPPGGNDWNGNAPGDVDWIDYVWASGLRNPFSGDVHPATGRYFVNDVGEVTWEEINDATIAGRNFGWPTTEGTFNPATFPNFTNPVYTYSHGEDCAITGGAFYSPALAQFPAQYEGKYFFSEFCAGEINTIDPNSPGSVISFATGAEFPMNIEVAPDGSLYYIARGAGAGGAPGIGTGTIRKIQFAAQIAPQIVQQPVSKLVSVGFDATFTASAAGTAPLGYQWQRHNGTTFVDVPGATLPALMLSSVTMADNGAQFRVVVTNSFGSATSNLATLTVTTDTPPTPTILTPEMGSTYMAGDTISFSASATDVEDGALGAASMTWQVDFHHNVHAHPFLPPTSGISADSFVIPTIGETAADVFFRITLTVTDSAGLSTTVHRDVNPVISNFTVLTNFGGGQILVDGQPKPAPLTTTGVVNIQRSLTAPLTQITPGGELAAFVRWLDGETSATRMISTPAADKAYIALYANASDSLAFLSDLPAANDPAPNGWGPIERDTSNGEAAASDGVPMAIQGIGYAKGLGVHALSDVRYNLGGSFERFIADVGVDDETGAGGSVTFQVFGDGVELTNVIPRTGSQASVKIDVSVAGVNELRLVVTNAGDGDGLDHANWANARLIGTQTGSQIAINFQTADALVPAGYLADAGLVFANRGNGQSYGWSSNHADVARDRNINSDQRLDTLSQFHAGQIWELALPNGVYAVTMSIGDPEFVSTHTLNVEGVSYWNNVTLNPNQFRQRTLLVTVTDGRLTLDQGSLGDRATRPNYIEVIPTSAPSLFQLKLGNFDGDADVDGSDFLIWQRGLGTASPVHAQGDGDEDGDVDAADLAVWRASYATSYAAAPAAAVASAPALAGAAASAEFDWEASDLAAPVLLQLGESATSLRPGYRPALLRTLAFESLASTTMDQTVARGLGIDRGDAAKTARSDAPSARDGALDSFDFDWLDALAEQNVTSAIRKQ